MVLNSNKYFRTVIVSLRQPERSGARHEPAKIRKSLRLITRQKKPRWKLGQSKWQTKCWKKKLKRWRQ